IGRKRGCVVSGGGVDTIRVSNIILDEYRTGKLGRITLELPGDLSTQDDSTEKE
ncbi:MAG: ribosome biogenesis GTPase YlqF, partial [Clostridium sp.]